MCIQLQESAAPYEDDVAQCWWKLPPGCMLPLSNGQYYQLLFAGCPGGSVGPDVRDAVLRDIVSAKKIVGDIEFHVYASDWVVHQHHCDPRYNAVVLHIVFVCDDARQTVRQDGRTIPVCSLNDIPMVSTKLSRSLTPTSEAPWPCQRVMPLLSKGARNDLLRLAGLLRFEQKTQAFVVQLRGMSSDAPGDYDYCLIPALAEGLGYGRDRDFFRAVGLRLLGIAGGVPEPLGRSTEPSPLDADRLSILQTLVTQWRTPGARSGGWQTLRLLLSLTPERNILQVLQTVRLLFCELGLSLARTDILICNVVLPFAAAIAMLECDVQLAQCARELYLAHPGLSSNRITRMMRTQLQLQAEPRGSCQQQGLHYIYQQTCREKLCSECIVGRSVI